MSGYPENVENPDDWKSFLVRYLDNRATSAAYDGLGLVALHIAAAIKEAHENHGTSRRWRHKKRGTTYTEIGRGTFQLAGDTSIADEEAVMIYQGADGALWVRPLPEFEDGRFEEINDGR